MYREVQSSEGHRNSLGDLWSITQGGRQFCTAGEGGDWAPSPLDAEEIGARIHLLLPTFTSPVFCLLLSFLPVIFHPHSSVPIPKVKTKHPIMSPELVSLWQVVFMFLICSQICSSLWTDSMFMSSNCLLNIVIQMVGGSIITLSYYFWDPCIVGEEKNILRG